MSYEIDSRGLENLFGEMFSSEPTVKEQFERVNFRIGSVIEPERKLMLALLGDAFGVLERFCRSGGKKNKKLFAEELQWIKDETEEDYIYTFTNICETLGFAPSCVRKGILAFLEKS
ncbi:hypothetical protein HYT01_02885 [Candidatus Giovannonibacteria bacterium]|nr:hypothetical protein [Candidatus Giovannonibacteria bacterium]